MIGWPNCRAMLLPVLFGPMTVPACHESEKPVPLLMP